MTFSSLLLAAFVAFAFTQLAIEQHTALMAFYDAVGCNTSVCPRFQSNQPCTGAGLTCSGSNVTYLLLSDNQLTGTIPSTVGHLSSLSGLDLSSNRLTGTIPSAFWQLVSLRGLDLSGSQLTGTIPSAVGQLILLGLLDLHSNQLTGTIPSAVGQLVSLDVLYLSDNQLTGTIPSAVGQLASLQLLDLSGNQLTGTIPSVVEQLASLSYLNISKTQLSGTFPSSRAPFITCGPCTEAESKSAHDLTLACQATFSACSSAADSDNARKCHCFLDSLECFKVVKVCTVVPSPEPTSPALRQVAVDACVAVSGCLPSQCDALLEGPTTATIATDAITANTEPIKTDTTEEPPALSAEIITIIIAVAASVGGVLLICLIVFCVIKRAKSKGRASTPTEMKSAMADGWSDRDTTATLSTSVRKRESEYQSDVPLAADLHHSSSESEQPGYYDGPVVRGDRKKQHRSASSAVYHVPPASTSTGIASERSKPSSHKNSKHKSKSKDEPSSTTGSVRTIRTATTTDSVRPVRTTEVLHIPIDEIELGKELGQGAFGIVYKGHWDHKPVAVKQVKASNMVGGDKAIAEFEAEVSQMASTAYHENLVQLYGVTTLENGDMAAVVEFCAKGSLVDALYGDKARDWSTAQLFSVAHGAACGVAHLHRQSVIHRDIAARNVLLTKHGVAKVADFGMARLLAESVYDEQQTMNAVGPLKWMAPEQIERRAYSRASDVFAFGVLLYEIFQREVPWQGVYNLAAATMVVNGERMDVSSHKIPRRVASLMLECWEHEPDKRPSIKHVQRVLHDNAPSIDESATEW